MCVVSTYTTKRGKKENVSYNVELHGNTVVESGMRSLVNGTYLCNTSFIIVNKKVKNFVPTYFRLNNGTEIFMTSSNFANVKVKTKKFNSRGTVTNYKNLNNLNKLSS